MDPLTVHASAPLPLVQQNLYAVASIDGLQVPLRALYEA